MLSFDSRRGSVNTRFGRIGQDAFVEDFDHTVVFVLMSIMMQISVSGRCILQRADPDHRGHQRHGQSLR